MTNTPTPPDIVRINDKKIRAFLENGDLTRFWYTQSFASLPELHALGFDNYPVAAIPAVDELHPHLFFFEKIMGAQLESPDDNEGNFFHTWCKPLISNPSDISRLVTDPSLSAVWQNYENAVIDYLSKTPEEECLPLSFPGLSPLDMACNLCGPESFFLMLHEKPEAAGALLDMIVTLLIESHRRIRQSGTRVVAPFGFPGVYCNDLQLPSLSPEHVARFILPCYKRLGDECGGLLLALSCADPGILRSALAIESLIGCSFDKRLPLPEIKKHLGRKLFIISGYCYDESLDRPTLRNGIWWNPIVQTYSREPHEVYREFADTHSMLINIERPSLSEILAVRQTLTGKMSQLR